MSIPETSSIHQTIADINSRPALYRSGANLINTLNVAQHFQLTGAAATLCGQFNSLQRLRLFADHVITTEIEAMAWEEITGALLLATALLVERKVWRRSKSLYKVNPVLHGPYAVPAATLTILHELLNLETFVYGKPTIDAFRDKIDQIISNFDRLMAARESTVRYGVLRCDPKRLKISRGLTPLPSKSRKTKRLLVALIVGKGHPLPARALAEASGCTARTVHAAVGSDATDGFPPELSKLLNKAKKFLTRHRLPYEIRRCNGGTYALIQVDKIVEKEGLSGMSGDRSVDQLSNATRIVRVRLETQPCIKTTVHPCFDSPSRGQPTARPSHRRCWNDRKRRDSCASAFGLSIL